MNIIDAVQSAVENNVAIMNLDRQEWIILSGGALRYKCNREAASLTPKDILSMAWITENDLISLSKEQLKLALGKLSAVENDGVYTIVGVDDFFESIMHANYANQRLKGDLNART